MKIILSCIAAFLLITANAQSDTSDIAFITTTHSFGKIKQGVPATTEFAFVNNSDKNVIIETAVAECGCTTPDYPKTPIQKGKTGIIKVTFNAETPGTFSKLVTVKFANIKLPVILTIEGEVTP